MRSNARPHVRTRSIGTISDSIARIGLILSVEPIHACAPPIRPPRRRNSSVSTANRIFSCSRAARARAAASCRSRRPSLIALAAATAIRPSPAHTLALSSTTIRSARRRARRAGRAPARPSARCRRSRPTGGSRGCRCAGLDQRLVDGEEVADRRLRRRRQLARRAQVVVERVEVGQVGLAVVVRRVAPAHVERDGVEPVALDDLARHVVRRVDDDRRPGPWRDTLCGASARPSRCGCDDRTPMGTTLVTGASGFVGSHVARALVERGDRVRVTLRASSSREALDGPRRRGGDRAARRPRGAAPRAARRRPRVPRRRHDVPARHAGRALARQRRGHADGDGGGAAGRRRARRAHVVGRARSARRRPHGAVDERSAVPRRAGRALRGVQARRGDRGAARRRARARRW